MKVVLTNLSNQVFAESRQRLNDSARQFGINDILSWDFEDLKKTAFYKQHQAMLDQPKGLGYWAWKPYLVLEAFNKISEGDVLIYSDCGHEIIADLQPLIDICHHSAPVMLFENGDLKNAMWTKRDCFVRMGCDTKLFWYGAQVDASFLLVRKSQKSIQFMEEWLRYCCDPIANTSAPNQLGKRNLPLFIEHRWDQSILSLLAIKWQLELYRMPSQFGNHYKAEEWRVQGEFNCKNQYKPIQLSSYSKYPKLNSPYGQLLNHHRKKAGVNENMSSKSILQSAFGYPYRLSMRIASFLHRQFS
jgi:hypothetical protein